MVVGNGMIAKAFSGFRNDPDIIVFASGVSNSRELDPLSFEKEFSLIKSHSGSAAIFVYFSTCSIYDPELQQSAYVQHKIKAEKFIRENFSRYWIFRLPNVISHSENPHTMCNFFYNSIAGKKKFVLHENAYRYFVDVDDVRGSLGKAMKSEQLKSGTYNFLYPHALSVKDLVKRLERQTGMAALFDTVSKGTNYRVDISEELKPFCNFLNEDPDSYFSRIIGKYFPARSIV